MLKMIMAVLATLNLMACTSNKQGKSETKEAQHSPELQEVFAVAAKAIKEHFNVEDEGRTETAGDVWGEELVSTETTDENGNPVDRMIIGALTHARGVTQECTVVVDRLATGLVASSVDCAAIADE